MGHNQQRSAPTAPAPIAAAACPHHAPPPPLPTVPASNSLALALPLLPCPRPVQETEEEAVRKYNMTGQTGAYIYMAPEVLLGTQYNEKVDVFRCGRGKTRRLFAMFGWLTCLGYF